MFNTQIVTPGQQPISYGYGLPPTPYGQPQSFLAQAQRSPPNCQLFVSDFEDTLTGNMLLEYFQRFGTIMQFMFPINQTTKRSRGFAFITFQYPADAQKAINEANHKKVLNNPIRVFSYKPNFKDMPKEANLFLNNLHDSIEEKDIEDWFRDNGITGVVSCKILYENGRSKGYGYVQLDNIKNCDELLNNCQGFIKIKDREVMVDRFQPKTQRPTLKNNLYIKNLPEPQEIDLASEDALKERLLSHFEQFGRISSALVKQSPVADPITNHKGLYAFICFADDESHKATDSAQEAMFSLNGQDIFGINKGLGLEIHYFEKKSDRMKRNMVNNLYTNNLREDVKESDVYRIYSSFGSIIRYTVRHPNRERSVKEFKTLYAMIQYSTKEEAQKALSLAPKAPTVQELYANKVVFLTFWMDKESRAKVKQAKLNSGRFNKQLYGIPPEQQAVGLGPMGYNQPPMQFAQPQFQPQFGYSQQLGAPTVGNAVGAPMNPQMGGGFNAPPQYNNPGYQPQQVMPGGGGYPPQGQQFNKQPRNNYGAPRGGRPGGRGGMPRQGGFNPNMNNNNMSNKVSVLLDFTTKNLLFGRLS